VSLSCTEHQSPATVTPAAGFCLGACSVADAAIGLTRPLVRMHFLDNQERFPADLVRRAR
jgi:hypothetical protein